MKKNVFNLYFYKDEPNFGDALNLCLLQTLFGVDIRYEDIKKCDCVCIGSLLQLLVVPPLSFRNKIKRFFAHRIAIWGTGFINQAPEFPHTLSRKTRIYALRGKISLARMQKYTKRRLRNVVLGDPGLLANRLIDTKKIEKKYKLGIIPHYVDKNNPLLDNINVEQSVIIDVQKPVMEVLVQIAQCENIISSAMHGLIVADSLGIPNARMVLSNKIVGGDYKFQDYYSAFDMAMPPPLIMTPDTHVTNVDFIKQEYRVSSEKIEQICQKLLKVFPYK